MPWEAVGALAGLGGLSLSLLMLAFTVRSRLLHGEYAPREWVEAKLKPLSDADILLMGRLRDVEAEHALLKQRMGYLPTIEHLDLVKDRVNDQGHTTVRIEEKLSANNDKLDHIGETVDEIWKELNKLKEKI